jgi:hypothetical protein
MATANAAEFEQLDAAIEDGVPAVIERMIEQLRQRKKYHHLFEALKLRLRYRMGLPLWEHTPGEQLDPEQRDRYEDGLIEACREVGMLLLENGHVRDGWMFLQPVGDNAAVAAALRSLDPDDDNIDQIVDVSLHAGVDPELGFGLVLEHYGTCNAITTFDQVMPGRPLAAQQTAAAMLLAKLHWDLVASVKADIAQQEGAQPRETTLAELVEPRDWLFAENSYHIDTTHLAAVVRFARLLDNPDKLRMALDLTDYGRRLGPQFQYKHDEPFAEFYPAHALYFRAMLGENVDEAIRYFREKSETLEPRQHGTMPIETYIDLLARLGRNEEAMEASLSLLPHDMPTLGFAPPLFDLCRKAGHYERLMEHCRDRDDLLGYGVALMQSKLETGGRGQRSGGRGQES